MYIKNSDGSVKGLTTAAAVAILFSKGKIMSSGRRLSPGVTAGI
jgi:hypothetical protein